MVALGLSIGSLSFLGLSCAGEAAGENEQAIKTIAGTPGAIGYVSIGTAEVDIKTGVAIKLLDLDGVAASTENVAAGSYLMARPLNLITGPSKLDTGKQAGELVWEFIEFARSADNADLVRREGFVPVATSTELAGGAR